MNNFSKEKIDNMQIILAQRIIIMESLIKLAEFLHEHNIKKALNASFKHCMIIKVIYLKNWKLRKELSESLFNELENCVSLSDIAKKE